MRKKLLSGLLFTILGSNLALSQGSPDIYKGGLKVNLNESGSKYFRLISWAQLQGIYNASSNLPDTQSPVSANVRRARVLMYSQISDRFLILTHFGLNSLNADNMSPIGTGANSQLFFHDVWGQWAIGDKHAVGAGLHYFNGISRLNNQSTLNMLTLDNNRQSWSTIGLTDQFARHLGVFGKGSFGRLQYRVAINDAVTNGLDTRDPEMGGAAVYGGKRLLGSKQAGLAYAGYFEYHLKDVESNFLPYKVGTYLGTKTVFNVGAGFFLHPNGSVIMNSAGEYEGQNVSLAAVDVFYEAPVGTNGQALSAYATYQYNNYGQDYLYSAYGTGSMIYGQLGYVLPGDNNSVRLQPYVSVASNMYDATDETRDVLGVGLNTYLSGHHSKLTFEYKNTQYGANPHSHVFTAQAMIYL